MVWCLRKDVKKVNLVSDSSRQLDLANFSVPLVYLPHIGPHRAPSLDPTSWPFLPRCLKDQNVLSILVAQLGGFHEDVRHLQQNLLGSSPTDGGFLTWYPEIILFPNHPAFLGYPIVGNHHIWIHHFLSRSKASAKMLCDMAQIPARDGVATRGLVGGFNRLEKY